jgi:flavodoxin
MRMRIELYHASKFGNGARVAEELRSVLEAAGHSVNVHHIKEANPKKMPEADLYIFGSPTRIGRPIGSMRRFIKKVLLPPETRYAVFATHGEAVPDKKTGKIPPDEEMKRWRKTIPYLDEVLKGKGLQKIADKMLFVSGDTLKGTLIEGWQEKVKEFAQQIAP